MPLPLPNLPEQRVNMDPLPRFHVVTPDGKLKGIPFERNVESPLVRAEWYIKQGRRIGLKALSVSSSASELGYTSLEELYEAEDRAEDFQSYLTWYAKANKPNSARIPDLPEEYLPDEVLRRRRDYETEQLKLVLPPPKRKRKAAEEGEGKPAKTAKSRKARVRTGS